MFKKTIATLFVVLVFTSSAFSEPCTTDMDCEEKERARQEESQIIKTELIKIHKISMKKGSIHNAVFDWISKAYNDPNAVIKMSDKKDGRIVVNGYTYCDFCSRGSDTGVIRLLCKFRTVVDIKDNRYRVCYDSFLMCFPSGIEFSLYTACDSDAVIRVLTNLDNQLFEAVKHYKKSENW